MRDEDWTKFKNLNLGCGQKAYPDCVNVDKRDTIITHIVWDLNMFPYPFADNRFERVYAQDIMEHLDDVYKVMEEIHRILKLGGDVHIRTVPWNKAQSYNDPSHKHWFNLGSFDFFDPETFWGRKYAYFSPAKFTVLKKYEDGEELVFVLKKRE
jgi:ubiquinone/menaquinone biosynthesis C-methylase UbiE